MARKPKTPKTPPVPALPSFDGTPQNALTVLAGKDYGIRDGLLAGDALGGSYYADGSLGRVFEGFTGTDPAMNAVDPNAMNEQELLARYRSESFEGGKRSPLAEETLGRLRSSLGGLNSEEMMAARDEGTVGMNRGLMTGMRAMRARYPGARGPAAAIAARPVMQSFADANAGLERKLLLDNYGAKQEALGRYAGYGRELEEFETSDRANRLDRFANLQGQMAGNLLNRRTFNLQQLAREKAGKLGLIFGAGEFGAAQQGRRESMDIAREGLKRVS